MHATQAVDAVKVEGNEMCWGPNATGLDLVVHRSSPNDERAKVPNRSRAAQREKLQLDQRLDPSEIREVRARVDFQLL
ncbi:MAG: hypothetical protein ACK58T_30945, partial [Phycisphaerae bacterium]